MNRFNSLLVKIDVGFVLGEGELGEVGVELFGLVVVVLGGLEALGASEAIGGAGGFDADVGDKGRVVEGTGMGEEVFDGREGHRKGRLFWDEV